MWRFLIDQFLSGVMVKDRLTVTFPDGSTSDYGPETGEQAHISVSDPGVMRRLIVNPDLGMGEGYMDGAINPQNCTLEQLMAILIRNRQAGTLPPWLRAMTRLRTRMRRFMQLNAPAVSRRNVAHHYDISDDLYRVFLDTDMQYSCGYFPDPDMSLEEAQAAKKRHIAEKLRLAPGARLLDIGCGWGGLALTLARDYGCEVTGITLSENQLATAQKRAEAEGLGDKVDFRLKDYRHMTGEFDRVVSVGMLEHVGLPNYGTYFGKIAEVMDPDGIALIHTIGWSAPPQAQSPWITKYIFPGGHVPALSELVPAIERSGLIESDLEVWRLHYARTLRHWRERFEAHCEELRARYDDRFVRMFRYYLTVCQLAFEYQPQVVYQFQLAHKLDAVPLTRDYLYGGNRG